MTDEEEKKTPSEIRMTAVGYDLNNSELVFMMVGKITDVLPNLEKSVTGHLSHLRLAIYDVVRLLPNTTNPGSEVPFNHEEFRKLYSDNPKLREIKYQTSNSGDL